MIANLDDKSTAILGRNRLMSKHTAGPWIYYNARAHQNGSDVYTLTSLAKSPASAHNGIWLADIRQGREGDQISILEGMANARLMATAPELLAACESALRFAESIDPDEATEVLEILQAAIKKATTP
jgi:hypothetical protein